MTEILFHGIETVVTDSIIMRSTIFNGFMIYICVSSGGMIIALYYFTCHIHIFREQL